MTNGIRTTIDGAGRIVIPKAIREAAGIYATDEVEVRLGDGGIIELEVVPRQVRLEESDGIVVAVPLEQGEALSDTTVTATRRALRGEGRRPPDGG